VKGYPLTAAAITKANVDGTVQRVTAALTERLQATARLHAEQVQLEIEKAVETELKRLSGFAETVAGQLRAIEVEFRLNAAGREQGSDMLGDGGAAAAGFAGGVLAGGIGGGLVSGAFAGYRAAGWKGAAVGSAAGVAVATGTVFTAAFAAALIGLPITWPVLLPILAVGGLTSAFASRKIVQFVFGADATETFRAELERQVLEQLDASSAQRVTELAAAFDRQVDETFAAVRAHVEQELGAPLAATRANLDQLRAQLARSHAERERDTVELRAVAARVEAIAARSSALASHLATIASH
jgi:hypothetical protein